MTAALLVGYLMIQQGVFCGSAKTIAESLRHAREMVVGQGFSQVRGALLQLWASPAGGWTVIAVLPDGRACLIDAGIGWEPAPVLEKEG